MPTRKEVSKIKSDFVKEREKLIRSHMSDQQLKLYDTLVDKYLKGDLKKDSKKIISQIESAVKSFAAETNTEILKQYTSSAYSLGDLNMAYYSTMFDDKKKLNFIKQNTTKIVNKRLGLNDDGTLKKRGFVDKMIKDTSIQKRVIKEVRNAVTSGADILTLKNKLKKIVVGSPEESGVFERHYNTFAKDILNRIDNSNGNIYAESLGLNYAYYSGGLIKTSRSICIKNNGKILSRDQIENLRNDPFIIKMYGKNIADYNPYELPGGIGCLHTLDWITDELAQGHVREQNAIAKERNQNFKARHNL